MIRVAIVFASINSKATTESFFPFTRIGSNGRNSKMPRVKPISALRHQNLAAGRNTLQSRGDIYGVADHAVTHADVSADITCDNYAGAYPGM